MSRSGGEDFEGISVTHLRSPLDVREMVAWADIVFTHLNETKMVEQACRKARTPLVNVIHNHRSLRVYRVAWCQLIVFNSYWLRDRVTELRRAPRTVVWPFIPQGGGNGGPEGAVGLVNLMEAKGARLFYDLAQRIPSRSFEGVRGAYGAQIPNPHPNVTVRTNQSGLEWFWPHIGVYLQPSHYESFGMAAAEAMGRGIPVLATPTPGLVESVADGGIFHPLRDPEAWEKSLRLLEVPDAWGTMSVAASDRAAWLAAQAEDQLTDLELLLHRL